MYEQRGRCLWAHRVSHGLGCQVFGGFRRFWLWLRRSNLPFDEWTEVFGSERLTGALLDRLTHHVHILEMNGDSYRTGAILVHFMLHSASQLPPRPRPNTHMTQSARPAGTPP